MLFVPDEAIISLYRARSVPWAKKLIKKGFDKLGMYKESAYMVIYLMHLKLLPKEQNELHHWMDTLPTSTDEFPVFFEKKDMNILDGSPIVEKINI